MRAHTQGTSRVLLIMGFAVLAAAMLVLSGCGQTRVPNRAVLKAQELCASHGGIGELVPQGFDVQKDKLVTVVCANGTKVVAPL